MQAALRKFKNYGIEGSRKSFYAFLLRRGAKTDELIEEMLPQTVEELCGNGEFDLQSIQGQITQLLGSDLVIESDKKTPFWVRNSQGIHGKVLKEFMNHYHSIRENNIETPNIETMSVQELEEFEGRIDAQIDETQEEIRNLTSEERRQEVLARVQEKLKTLGEVRAERDALRENMQTQENEQEETREE